MRARPLVRFWTPNDNRVGRKPHRHRRPKGFPPPPASSSPSRPPQVTSSAGPPPSQTSSLNPLTLPSSPVRTQHRPLPLQVKYIARRRLAPSSPAPFPPQLAAALPTSGRCMLETGVVRGWDKEERREKTMWVGPTHASHAFLLRETARPLVRKQFRLQSELQS